MTRLRFSRLGIILEEISRQLYTVNPHSRDPPLETAIRLTTELEKWKESASPLFDVARGNSLIPPLRRQSQVLELAYSHAMIHATRSFLLNDFVDSRRKPPAPDPIVTSHIQKCIDASEDVLKVVDRLGKQGILIQSFWFTHYVCFCAIIVVYIHTIQQHRLSSLAGTSGQGVREQDKLHYLFRLAEACQQHLAEATRANSPSRRYSIILEELRLEVHRQIGTPFQSSPNTAISDTFQPRPIYTDGLLDQKPLMPPTINEPLPLDSTPTSYPPIPGSLQPPDLAQGSFSTSEDVGFLENLDGSIWWTHLDSWVSFFFHLVVSWLTCILGILKSLE